MTHRSCYVLLVEDDSEDALFFSQAMTRAGVQWSLRVACSRPEAIQAMTQPSPGSDGQPWSEPDFVLLDVRLGESSGFQVLRWIRTHVKERMIPVVIFTSSVEPGIEEQAQEYGGTMFLQKPTTLAGAIQVVTQLDAKWCGLRDSDLPNNSRSKNGNG